MLNAVHSRLARVAVAALALTVAGCDNPVEDDHEEHPVGFVVLSGQTEVARFTGTTVTGQVSIARNTPTTFTVAAISEDGDQIAIDGTELSLQAAVTEIAGTATVQNNSQVVVTGTQAGTGVLTIGVLHEGHLEFSRPVVLVVTG